MFCIKFRGNERNLGCRSFVGDHFEPKLRFFELSQAAFLDVVLGEEKRGTDTGSACTDASKDEGPAEPVICIAGHPFVAVSEDGEDYDAKTRANSSGK